MTRASATLALLLSMACGPSSGGEPTVQVAFLRPVASQDGNAPFDQELEASGFVLGRNLQYVQDDPVGEVHVEPANVRDAVEGWIAEGVDLIVAFSSSGAALAASAAPQIPVLFLVNDPVAVGLVSDPARPDRNLTGATFRIPADRTLHLARQAIPGLTTIGILEPSSDPAAPPARDAMMTAATELGLASVSQTYRDQADIRRAMSSLRDQGANAIVVVNAPTSIRFLSVIEPAAAALRLPLIANTALATGALVVLEPDVGELLGRLGRQAARLLAGVAPADIPVENPTGFRVVLNSAVADDLGLPPLPIDLIRQADLVRR